MPTRASDRPSAHTISVALGTKDTMRTARSGPVPPRLAHDLFTHPPPGAPPVLVHIAGVAGEVRARDLAPIIARIALHLPPQRLRQPWERARQDDDSPLAGLTRGTIERADLRGVAGQRDAGRPGLDREQADPV